MQYVEIDLFDGKQHQLGYDFNAIADVESKLDMGLNAMFEERRFGTNTIRALIWGGLKWRDHKLTIPQTGKMLHDYFAEGGSIEALIDKIRAALRYSGVVTIEEIDDTEKAEVNIDEGNLEAETVAG
jgi:hypothetical protein